MKEVLRFIKNYNSRYFTISTITKKTGLTSHQAGYALKQLRGKKVEKRTKVTWEILSND